MSVGKVIGRVAIKVLPDTSDFRDKTANDLRRIEKQLGELEVDVIPTLDRSAKEKLRGELKSWAKGLDLSVKVDLDLNDGDVAKSIVALEALTKRRTVKIAPELDNGAVAKVAASLAAISGLRYTMQLFRGLREEIMRLDLAVPRIGGVSHAITVLGGWVLTVAGNLFSLSSSIASIGKAGLALPGILAGLAVGLATTVAALKDFNVQVPQAAKYMGQLQDIISQNFWAVAVGPIRELVDKLFPILNTKLAQTSTALGGFFAAFSNSAIEKLLPKLPPMFDNLTKSIQVSTGFTDAYVGVIEKLGSIGSSYLPRLAQWFGVISTQFDNFLAKTGQDGLKDMIDEGIEAMKDFGSVTSSTFSVFASLGRAAKAAGGSTLATLADTMRDVAAAAKSPGFQKGLTSTLKAAYDMLDQIGDIAGPALKGLVVAMSQNFQKIAPIVGDTVGTLLAAVSNAFAQPVVGKGLEAMFQGFNDAAHELAPVMDLVAEKVAVVAVLIGALARNLGVVMAAAIVTLKPIFISLVEAMLPIVNRVGPMLAQVITALGPVFKILGDALTRAATALGPMFDAVQKLINILLPVLVPVLKVVASIIGDAIVAVVQGLTWVFEGLVKIVTGVIQVFSGLWDIIAGIFTLDFSRVGEGIKKVFSGIGNIILGAIQTALGAIWAYLNGTVLGFFKKFAVKLLGPIAKPLGKFFNPIIDAATKVFGFLKKIWGKIAGLFKGGGGNAAGGITEKFLHIVAAVKAVFEVLKIVVKVAWKVISTIFGAAFKVISVIVGTAFKVISVIVKTYFGIIKTIVVTVFRVLKAVFSGALGAIRTVFTTVFGAIKSFLIATMDGLYFLFKGPWDAISAFIQITMVTIKTGIMMVWNSLRAFFLAIFDWFLVNFQMAWTSISTVTMTVFNAIKAFIMFIWASLKAGIAIYLDAIKAVITTVWGAIKTVIGGVLSAIWKVIKTVWNKISSVTSKVFNAVKDFITTRFGNIKRNVTNAVNAVKNKVSGAWNKIKDFTSSAFNKIKTIVKDAWVAVGTTIREAISDVVSKVKELPGKALDALGSIGTVLINSGKALIQGFIDGIGKMAGALKDKVGGVLQGARDLLPFSPAKEGPFSGRGWTLYSGRSLIEGLAQGIAERSTHLKRTISGTLSKAQAIASGTSLSSAGSNLGSTLIDGLNGSRQQILANVTSLATEIAEALNEAFDQTLSVSASGDLASSSAVQGVNFDRRLGGLERQVTSAARSAGSDTKSEAGSSVNIDNISIPLEDLAQLKDLEEFLDMLRVRTRQG